MILKKYVYENRIKELKDNFSNNDNPFRTDSAIARNVANLNDSLYDSSCDNSSRMIATVYSADNDHIYVVCAYDGGKTRSVECNAIIAEKLQYAKCLDEKEITLTEYTSHLQVACSKLTNYSVKTILSKYKINIEPRRGMFEPPVYQYEEELFDNKLPSKKEAMGKADKIMASESLKEELSRIYSPANMKQFYGHPVHYYITAGDWGAAQDMIRLLIPALLKNNRLISKRVTYVQNILPSSYQDPQFEELFDSAGSSTIVVDLSGTRGYGNYATGYQKNAEIIGKKLAELGKDVLFIFVEITDNVIYRDEMLAEILGSGDIVKIEEGYGDHDKAVTYLNNLIARSEFRDYKNDDALKFLPDKLSFSVSDVYVAFNKWYGSGLKTHVYKAYKNFETVKIKVKKSDGEPYKKLQKMVGLEQIKQIVDQIIIHEKMQMKRKELGLDNSSSCRHMLFYGNPGSAKTTVARLLAQILKAEGVLENGHIVECGRQDLVARYVGWTAKAVEEKFRAARGGILFIDEAYSLLEEHNTFGTEAINTIVQLMENYRDEVIVIFAGYPDKMRDFVAKNEGLASRIAFQLDFPDYDSNELIGIMELMLKEHQYTMSDEAKDKCLKLFDKVSKVKDYGNGRFVRNVLEQIELRQSQRIAREYEDLDIDAEKIARIEAEDVMEDFNLLTDKKSDTKIGYAY